MEKLRNKRLEINRLLKERNDIESFNSGAINASAASANVTGTQGTQQSFADSFIRGVLSRLGRSERDRISQELKEVNSSLKESIDSLTEAIENFQSNEFETVGN